MRTIIEADIFPVCPSIGAINQSGCSTTTTATTLRNMSPHRTRSNSNSSELISILSDEISIPTSPSSTSLILPSSTSFSDISDESSLDKDDNDIDYNLEYVYPTDSEDESSHIYDDDNNDELFIEKHVSRQQFNTIEYLQNQLYKRPKRSNKKMNAQRQIKTKHAKSIRTKSHNKTLYIHHRLAKKIILDEPSYSWIASPDPVPLYSLETLRSFVYQLRHPYEPSYEYYSSSLTTFRKSKSNHHYLFIDESQINPAPYQFRDYTLNEYNIPDEPSFDDDMVAFLLEMQNRDLSPEDYEMLLRLDERVQRKTLNKNVLDTLPTIDVSDIHLNDQCTICMEKYQHEQKLKLLPCKHMFHLNCIDTYLKEFSNQCPLDNLSLV